MKIDIHQRMTDRIASNFQRASARGLSRRTPRELSNASGAHRSNSTIATASFQIWRNAFDGSSANAPRAPRTMTSFSSD